MGFLSGILGGDAPSIPKPTDIFKPGRRGKPSVVEQQLTGVSDYYGQALPMFLGMQEQYTPQFLEQGFGFGGQALGGLFGLQRQASAESAQQMAALRAQEIGDITGQTGLFRNLVGALSPEQEQMVRLSTDEARRATQAARGLTPEEQRAATQRARESYGSRGMLGSTGSVVAEALGRENVLSAKRAEADAARTRAFGLAGEFYSPGLQFLSSTPASYGAGLSQAGIGLQLGQSMGADLDYNLPLNLARERASALDARNMAQYQADMQARQSALGGIGSILGLAAIPFTGGLSAGLGLTGLAGGAAGATGLSGLGLSTGMGLRGMFGSIPKAIPV